jgi:hypothetical protein
MSGPVREVRYLKAKWSMADCNGTRSSWLDATCTGTSHAWRRRGFSFARMRG